MTFESLDLMSMRWDFELQVDAVTGWEFGGPQDGVNVFCMWDGHKSQWATRQPVVDKIIVPKSTTYSPEPVTILSHVAKETLQMWLRLGNVKWGDYSGLSRWPQSNHMSPLKVENLSRLCQRQLWWWKEGQRELTFIRFEDGERAS